MKRFADSLTHLPIDHSFGIFDADARSNKWVKNGLKKSKGESSFYARFPD
jgi:hypothetical protein